MHTGFETCGVCIKMNADASWGQTTGSSNTNDTGIALNEGQLVQFCEIVHFGYYQLAEPRCDNAIAVVVVHFGGVE